MNLFSKLVGSRGAAVAPVTDGGTPEPDENSVPVLFGGFKPSANAINSDCAARRAHINQERDALYAARIQQQAAIARLTAEIDQLESERVDLLADAFQSGATQDQWQLVATSVATEDVVAKAPEPLRMARERLLSVTVKRQALADAQRLVAVFDERASAFDDELKTLRLGASVEVGAVLDGMFESLAEEYSASARKTADLLVKIAAVQDAMMYLRTGNSNGFDRRGFIPQIVHDARHELVPFIDCGSGHLKQQTKPYVDQILADIGSLCHALDFRN